MEHNRQNIYIFNPGHDLALANGSVSFVPPLAVQQMQFDLSLLPLWYASEGAIVLSDDEHAADYLSLLNGTLSSFGSRQLSVQSSHGLQDECLPHISYRAHPWGWDKSVRAYLSRCGIAMADMPGDEELDAIKWSSSRERAVELLPHLQMNDNYIGSSFYFRDIASCSRFAASHSACVFKAPLSGSGKGLLWHADGVFSSPFERWCARQLSTQGGVVAEPIYNKVYDVAVEVIMDEAGKASFAGYSFFNTTPTGVYRHNMLVPDNFRADTFCMQSIAHDLLPHLLLQIEKMFAHRYCGCLGIDMMICADSDGKPQLIHPCVEINARMTMGIVAHAIYNRYVSREVHGEFHVGYHKKEGEALCFHRSMSEKYPLRIEAGQIVYGYLSLVPVYQKTHSSAWIVVGCD
jgi:hypothetical protein